MTVKLPPQHTVTAGQYHVLKDVRAACDRIPHRQQKSVGGDFGRITKAIVLNEIGRQHHKGRPAGVYESQKGWIYTVSRSFSVMVTEARRVFVVSPYDQQFIELI